MKTTDLRSLNEAVRQSLKEFTVDKNGNPVHPQKYPLASRALYHGTYDADKEDYESDKQSHDEHIEKVVGHDSLSKIENHLKSTGHDNNSVVKLGQKYYQHSTYTPSAEYDPTPEELDDKANKSFGHPELTKAMRKINT